MKQTIYKIRMNDTVYKIDKVAGNSLDEVKELFTKKFDLNESVINNCELIAKQEGGDNKLITSDNDVVEALKKANINKKGARVLVIRLKEAQIKSEKATFENWKNLTQEQRKELKDSALAKAKEFHVIETSEESSSDSSVDKKGPGKMLWRKLRHVTMEKIKANPELAKNLPALKEIFSEVRGEIRECIKKTDKKCRDRSGSSKGKGMCRKWAAFGQEFLEKIETLSEKFPQMPKWKIGKIVKNSKKKTDSEISEIIQEKINKFQLDDAGKAKFTELRKEFPKMPEFLINKAICKNKDASIEDLTKKLTKIRAKAHKGMGKLKGIMEKVGSMMRGGHGHHHGPHHGPNHGHRHGPHRFESPDKKGQWGKEEFKLFDTLCVKYPQMPKFKIGKIIKNNKKSDMAELSEIIQGKLNKFQLDTAGKAKFTELRKEFPKMPEFLVNKAICKNKDATIEKLTKILDKIRNKVKEGKNKWVKGMFEKMGCMKKQNGFKHEMSQSTPYFQHSWEGPQGYGPQGYGPQGFGPQGYGPQGFGPQGFGPHGHGPHGHGPHGHGPHKHGRHGRHGHKFDSDSSEENNMKRMARHFKKMALTDSSDSSLEKRGCEKFDTLRQIYSEIPEKRLKMVIENHPKKDINGLSELIANRIAHKFNK